MPIKNLHADKKVQNFELIQKKNCEKKIIFFLILIFHHFFLIFLFFATVFSLKPIYLISGFENSKIYSKIVDPILYPECPNTNKIIIKNGKNYNTQLLLRYPDCAAKLLRLKFNTTNGKIEQLPGITTESTFADSSTFSEDFSAIIDEIKRLGYRDNENLFSIGVNHFFHPLTTFSVYDRLKNKVEEVFNRTGEKSIFISFDQGSNFASIFLSNYSKKEWVRKYVQKVVFLSPTFAGFPSISNLFSQSFFPFKSSSEFKKSAMRLPGVHFSLPNYAIYENFTLNNYHPSQIFEFLKKNGKVDDESEKIFRAVSEKYLKKPIAEPPIPSVIIISKKTAKTAIKPFISISGDSRFDEAVLVSARYACSRWKTRCAKSDRPSQIIFEGINGRTLSEDKVVLESGSGDCRVVTSGVCGVYADSNYVSSLSFGADEFTYEGPPGKPMHSLDDAFDSVTSTYYVSDTVNSETYNNTIEIAFKKVTAVDAFLYDSVYITDGTVRKYHGFPTLLYAYASLGENSQYQLAGIFESNPKFPDVRIQFVFPQYVKCDKLKLVFVELTDQELIDGPAKNPIIGNLIFIRHSFISSESIYSNVAYLKTHVIPNSEFTYTASDGMPGYSISNAFDDDLTTYYISSNANSETYKNFIEINFAKTETLESLLIDQIVNKINGDQFVQGFPTAMNIYASVGSNPYSLKMEFKGSSNVTWSRVCFHFIELIECDKLKIEFVEVTSQSIVGNSANVVIPDIYFIRYMNEKSYTSTNFNYSSDAYLVTYSVSPSKFVYSGDEGKPDSPLSNAFDGDPTTYYTPKTESSNTFINTITIEFTETISLIDIVYDLVYETETDKRTYIGYPSIINIYSSLGNEQFSLLDIFIGHPISPMTKMQLHFDNVVRCDKIKMEFLDISSNNLSIGNLYFIPVHVSDIIPFSGASETYMNDTYVYSNMVDKSMFTFSIDKPLENFVEDNMFDKNPNTYYISSTCINLSYHIMMEINFTEQVILNAFLIDSLFLQSGIITSFRGFPTGIKVYSSINGNPYELKAFFIGEPVYPWTRMQFIFPDYVRCDKLKLEFVHVTFLASRNLITNSLSIADLYLMHVNILPTPTSTETILPSQIPIEDVCESGTHCSFEGSIDNQVSLIITTTTFTNIQSNENGGALLLKNAGLNCTSTIFSRCQTKQSESEGNGGGGIYINNQIEMSNSVFLYNVNFSNCKADYGGAVYIYCESVESIVRIIDCFFTANQAKSTSSSLSESQLCGGSAIFITSKNAYINDCTFYRNIGESQLKMENIFDQSNNEKGSILLQSKASNTIRYCKFVIGREAESSLFYIAGENGVYCSIINSVFIGELSPGNYHINGKIISPISPKIIVIKCKFSSDYSRAFKMDDENEYITIQFQKQTFDYNENDDDNGSQNYYGYAIFGVIAVLVFIIIVIMKKQCDARRIENKIQL